MSESVENDFAFTWATGTGANVEPLATYQQDPAVGTGVQSGTAKSALANRAWRQASIIASVITQFIVAQTGQTAIDDGTTENLVTNFTKAASGRLLDTQVFNTAGANTYTPNPLATMIEIEMVGGGGAGGGCAASGASQVSAGAGGAAGGYVRHRTTAPAGPVYFTVGSQGLGGSPGQAGQNGGNTTFQSLTASGGQGGTLGIAQPANNQALGYAKGGAGTGGNIVNAQGGRGAYALYNPQAVGGGGGASFFGDGADWVSSSSSGVSSVTPGSGGSGAAQSVANAGAGAGGNGVAGIVIIREYA